MKNKLRLVLVEPNGSGGLIHYTYQMCTALANAGTDVTLVTGSVYELSDLPHNFEVNNMLDLWTLFDPQIMDVLHKNLWKRAWNKIRWTARRGVRAFRLVRAWIKLTSYLVNLRPDLIQFSKINFPFETFFLGYLQRRGLVLSQVCHEFELRESKSIFSKFFLRAYNDVYRHFSIIFFHANENRRRFLSLFPFFPEEATFVIPHGNSNWLLNFHSHQAPPDLLRRKYGLNATERVVLFFGLLAPSKGIDDLVDAFSIALKSCSAKLVIAGYPTKHFNVMDLQAKIAALSIADRIILDTRYIPLEEISPLMQLASVVVYPYLSSTQSGALQVAYTFGKPVIATLVGGLPEAVEEGKSGFLVTVHSPEEISEKIVILINDPQLATRMGQYAQYLSETRFSWDVIAREVLRVYDQLFETEASRGSLDA